MQKISSPLLDGLDATQVQCLEFINDQSWFKFDDDRQAWGDLDMGS